jgi:hypothetical protein
LFRQPTKFYLITHTSAITHTPANVAYCRQHPLLAGLSGLHSPSARSPRERTLSSVGPTLASACCLLRFGAAPGTWDPLHKTLGLYACFGRANTGFGLLPAAVRCDPWVWAPFPYISSLFTMVRSRVRHAEAWPRSRFDPGSKPLVRVLICRFFPPNQAGLNVLGTELDGICKLKDFRNAWGTGMRFAQ